jgi:hypothetical protein
MKPIYFTLAIGALALSVSCNSERAASETRQPAVESSGPAASSGMKVGSKAPAITVANTLNWNGDPPDLESLQGKVVVLDFWAFW